MSVELDWYGDKVTADIDLGILAGLTRAGNIVQASAKLNAPVDTGVLRSSIVNALDKDNFQAIISTNTAYASYIEFGTRYQSAQPYMRPALNDNQTKIKAVMVQEIKKKI